jgi:hypothetical protein
MKRKAANQKSISKARSAEPCSAGKNGGQGGLYEEAKGKTVDFIRYTEQSSDLPAFEIRFTDRTFLFIEPVPRIQFRVRYLRTSRGDIKTIRDYGVVPEHLIGSTE